MDIPLNPGRAEDDRFVERVHVILSAQHAIVSLEERRRFISFLLKSVRKRKLMARRWSIQREADDIVGLVQVALATGDLDEVI